MEHLERDKGANKLSHRVHCHTYPMMDLYICVICRYKIFWIFDEFSFQFQSTSRPLQNVDITMFSIFYNIRRME